MIKLGAKNPEGPSTRQKVLTRCMWLLGTCRNAIVVVASGALGFWFVSEQGSSPVRLMGEWSNSNIYMLIDNIYLELYVMHLITRVTTIPIISSSFTFTYV